VNYTKDIREQCNKNALYVDRFFRNYRFEYQESFDVRLYWSFMGKYKIVHWEPSPPILITFEQYIYYYDNCISVNDCY